MNLLLRFFNSKEFERRKKIKASLNRHLSTNGYSRKVKFTENGVSSFIYLPVNPKHRNLKFVGSF